MTEQHGPITLHHGDCLDVLRTLPDHSVDAVVTDPPYGLANTTSAQVAETVTRWINGERDYLPGGSGFMGKRWDAFVPPVAVWDDCLRVLKPGGHLLAFSGSRTFDLMALSIRLAGFDVRDGIAWLYGSGFPKSRNVTGAMDAYLAGERPEPASVVIRPGVYDVTRFLREARDVAGWTNRQIDELFGTNGMAGHWTSQASQPAVPSVRQWSILKESLGFGDDVDELVEQLASIERPEDWGQGAGGDEEFLGSLRKDGERAEPGDWGTALKPAFEPIVVARKPTRGSTTINVQTYGTGALNIGGCRIGTSGGGNTCPGGDACACVTSGITYAPTKHAERREGPFGRWPSNVVLDDSQAAEVDRQSGDRPAGGKVTGRQTTKTGDSGIYGAFGAIENSPYDDSGGASRFFYVAKPDSSERVRLDGTAHPTVKPIDLMRWLVRLVTPPGGTVLEPFAGSGTTAEACLLEGFDCIAIEREAEYLPLIRQRLNRRRDPVAAVRASGDDAGLFDLLAQEDAS